MKGALFIYHRIVLTLLYLSLSGCMVGPNFQAPCRPLVNSYTECPITCHTVAARGHLGKAQTFTSCNDVPSQWWRCFHSKKINGLVRRGIQHNPNLTAAKEALNSAEQTLRASVGNLFPAFTLQLSAQRGSGAGFFSSASSNNAVTGSNFPTGNIFTLFNAAVNVAYTLDIFGGLRREIEGLDAQADYQFYQWHAAYLTLTSNIVTTAVAVASLNTQIQVTKRLINEQEQQLKIIQQQFELGGASREDVLTQQTQVAQTKATLPPLEKSLKQNQHALAALIGTFPSQNCIPYLSINEIRLPTCLPIGIPSRLVKHRPDIQAAEALLKSANAEIGVATANMFPKFIITGTWGRSKTFGGSSFLSSQTDLWNIGGNLLQPLFKGGTLLAQRRASIAAYRQALAQYQQVVLQAFRNVADALRALEADAKELRAQKQAELAAYANFNLTRQQYRLGGVSYLTLLTAQRQYQQTRISVIQAQASRLTDTVALYQALGGGWWNC